jgi:hypothetical protein
VAAAALTFPRADLASSRHDGTGSRTTRARADEEGKGCSALGERIGRTKRRAPGRPDLSEERGFCWIWLRWRGPVLLTATNSSSTSN